MKRFTSKGIREVQLGYGVQGEGKDGWGVIDVSLEDNLEFRFLIT